jgi:hypothetical protein
MFSRKSRERAVTLLMLCLIVSTSATIAAKAEDVQEADFAAHARKLDPSVPRKERLAALEWLITCSSHPAAGKVKAEVQRCLQKDADAAVRAKAATALGLIAFEREPRVCPQAVVEALRDGDKEVRDRALDAASLFRKFTPEAVDILLRCVKDGDRDTRVSVMPLLGREGSRQEKVVNFLREATKDKDCCIRNNAHAALFNATGKLEDILPHCLEVQLDRLRAMKVEDQLHKLAKDDPDTHVRTAAEQALKKLAGQGEKWP